LGGGRWGDLGGGAFGGVRKGYGGGLVREEKALGVPLMELLRGKGRRVCEHTKRGKKN